MLFVLYQMASGGGPGFVLGGKDASQDSRIIGGMGAIYGPIAAELGDAVRLSQPVRSITQDAEGVTVRSERDSVRARRVIVAVPLAIASQIIYEPMLPADRSFLHQRMPSGAIVKISIVYDEPFWRADGLCGQSAAPGTPAPVTIDACTDTGTPGILCVITEGPLARQYSRLDEPERRQSVLDTLVRAVRRQGRQARRLPRAGLERRALFRWRHVEPRASRCAHRVRPRAARTVRPHSLGRHRDLAEDVRLG